MCGLFFVWFTLETINRLCVLCVLCSSCVRTRAHKRVCVGASTMTHPQKCQRHDYCEDAGGMHHHCLRPLPYLCLCPLPVCPTALPSPPRPPHRHHHHSLPPSPPFHPTHTHTHEPSPKPSRTKGAQASTRQGTLSPGVNFRSTPFLVMTQRRITPPEEPSRAIAWEIAVLTNFSQSAWLMPGLYCASQ